jgi:hypothetical protein
MKIRSLQFAWFIVGLLITALGVLWWIAGSNKAACRMNVRNVQQAVRSYQGMNNKTTGSPLDKSEIVGPGKFLETEPVCPSCGPYRWSPVVPGMGHLMIECEHPDHPRPAAETADW